MNKVRPLHCISEIMFFPPRTIKGSVKHASTCVFACLIGSVYLYVRIYICVYDYVYVSVRVILCWC